MVRLDRISSKALAVSAGLMAALMSTGAWAQANCTTTQAGPAFITNIQSLAFPPGAASSALSGAIGNVNTAFLTQQGSAFVSAPANPAPDQPGGGVWVRGVGGEVTVKNNSSSTGVTTTAAGVQNTAITNCNNSDRQSFAGGQIGADIARLNWNGWNIHLGTTAGYLSSDSRDSYGFRNHFDVPFLGTYLVATYGRFFADVLVRNDYFNVSLNNPSLAYNNQRVGAHGYSISTSAGYNFALQNNWFIEPSAGFIYSKTKVDDFTNAGLNTLPSPLLISGNISTNDVVSEIGRVSVRVGTTIATPTVVWQPFASASVFHEFARNVTTNYTSLPNNAFLASGGVTVPANFTQNTSTSRIGTYGQYSIGVAGQLVNTGWLGFVRVDYRNGDRLDGWTGNAGLRYQFTPGGPMNAMAADLPMKAKAPVAFIAPTNWTGFFIGGFFGGDAGRTRIEFVNAPVPTSSRPYVFGPIGGGQIGYNWQGASPWVFGVEGDIAASDVKGGRQCGTDPALNGGGGVTGALASAYFVCRDRSDWIATATARVGYSWGRTLYYVRGGGAWEESTISANCIFGAPGQSVDTSRRCTTGQGTGVFPANITTGSQTRTGYLVGFGTEFDLGRGWSAKSEYNFIDFGRHTELASDGFTTLRDRAYTSQVKVGVNYRFGGPVVARY